MSDVYTYNFRYEKKKRYYETEESVSDFFLPSAMIQLNFII